MRLLFVKDSLSWPRSSGHDVHSFHMMQALTRLGHECGLLTASEPKPEAIDGLPLVYRRVFTDIPTGPDPDMTWLQRKFAGYWGTDPARVRGVAHAAADMSADAVVVVGLNVLPYLGAVTGRKRVWYAADEWFWHHWSQVRLFRPKTWGELKQAVLKGLYERAFRSKIDRAWLVTDADRRAMRWVAGVKGLDVVPNGVDGEHFTPLDSPQGDRTCTFWGRLDFGPNVQALEWFAAKVWPAVRRDHPDAKFIVYGFAPTPPVLALSGRDGIEVIADLPDLRPEVARHQVVVLPFVSGGGIKNKFLEAAAMGKAIVCSPVACNGLIRPEESGAKIVTRPADWVAAIRAMWMDANARRAGGEQARAWVTQRHTWDAAARTAAAGLGFGSGCGAGF